jgi:hypothetical protein
VSAGKCHRRHRHQRSGAPILSGKDLASKLYPHLDNADFGGHAKAGSPPPNSMPSMDCIGMFFDHETFVAEQLM